MKRRPRVASQPWRGLRSDCTWVLKLADARIPSPLAGEGGRDGRMRGGRGGLRRPLIRPFGAPSPARGEGYSAIEPHATLAEAVGKFKHP